MVVFDAPDPAGVAEFWQRLMGWSIVDEWTSDDWVTVRDERGVMIGFQQAPGLKRPTWPDPQIPQQAHLDLYVHDVAAVTSRALELGALELDRSNPACQILADPAGHPFCVCADPERSGD
jgi:predicted enzyme related to lactoylglutathione lyase